MKIFPDLSLEKTLWRKGFHYIVGIDEVGRGSWAGPLVAAGVILPLDFKIPQGLADSKQVLPQKRIEFSKIIKKTSLAYEVVSIENKDLDKIGLTKATNYVFKQIVKRISLKPDFCLIDAFYIKYFSRKKQLAIKNGDQKSASIACASIIAKVYRDELMVKLHKVYPRYQLNKHKGYGTKIHQKAITKWGLSQIHRKSYNLQFLSP